MLSSSGWANGWIDGVDFDKGKVSLQDMALADLRMPIFREEPLAVVRELYEQEQDVMEHPLPDYKVGDNVIVDLPTRTIEGTIGYADAIALGKHIKAVRKAMKMTQEQLALKSNVSVKYIANIENGKQNPSFDILSAILHVLPLSLDSVINPNLSEAERECRELESIYFACPPEMRKTLLDATRSLAIHLTELSEQNKNT